MAPGQYSGQRCEFWLAAVGLEELHHPPEIPGEKTLGVGLASPDVFGQGFDGLLPSA